MESINENTAAELSATHAELLNLGERIRVWQLAQEPKLSDEALRARFPELGSTRTYKRIHTGDGIESLDGDEWLAKYQAAWERINEAELVRTAEPIYDDLSSTVAARAAVAALMQETGNQRLVVIQGDTGTGKSVALRAIREKYGRTAYLIESHEGWSSLASALRYFAEGLGIRPADGGARPASSGDWLELIIEKANARGRRIVLLDECQHWGGEMLNALKTLINRTDWVFVVAAMGTLWEKLTRNRYLEAKQLTLNRMLERVVLDGPTRDDAKKILTRRASVNPSKEKLDRMLELSETRGDFAFVRRVVAALNAQRDEVKGLPDDERLSEAVASVLKALKVD
jgi:hypothetical protein